jgi:hypothetical protein
MKDSSNPFLGFEPAIPIPPCVSSLKIKEWLTKKHSKYTAATSGMRQSKLFTERPSEKLSRDLLPSDRKQCRLVTGLLTGHCTLREHLHVMCLLDNFTHRKCGQMKESPYHILSVLASDWTQNTDLQLCIFMVSIKQVLAIVLRTGLF